MKVTTAIFFAAVLEIMMYFAGAGLRALDRDPVTFPEARGKRHFAVLIPARNEEAVIAQLVRSLKKQNYPGELVDIYVLVNHCTDNTASAAKNAGAEILYCPDSVGSKGDVLRFAFSALADREAIDAFVIFDADNVVDGAFLSTVNNAMAQGYGIVQGRRRGKNARDNVITGVYELYYMMQNIFYNHPRALLGQSAAVNGTGWAITRQWVRENGFPMVTITEDFELTAVAALKGTGIGYASGAVTYDEYPDSLKKVFRQLPRWIFGQVQCMRFYAGKCLRRGFRDKACMDLGLLLLQPALCFLLCAILVLAALSCGPARFRLRLRHILPMLLGLLYILMALAACLEVKKSGESVGAFLGSILLFPLFLGAWIPISAVSVWKRKCRWRPVLHERVISIEELS